MMSVGFSPDRTLAVSSSADESVRIWYAATGEIKHVLEEHSHVVNYAAPSQAQDCDHLGLSQASTADIKALTLHL